MICTRGQGVLKYEVLVDLESRGPKYLSFIASNMYPYNQDYSQGT